ncbi:MAG: anti-sigma factor domain-containing protein [Chitinophagales bacterium]
MALIKGVVLQRQEKNVVVLTDEGEFRTFNYKRPVEIGSEIFVREYREYWLYLGAAVMIFILTWGVVYFLGTGGRFFGP